MLRWRETTWSPCKLSRYPMRCGGRTNNVRWRETTSPVPSHPTLSHQSARSSSLSAQSHVSRDENGVAMKYTTSPRGRALMPRRAKAFVTLSAADDS